jgi:hypothetical protein
VGFEVRQGRLGFGYREQPAPSAVALPWGAMICPHGPVQDDGFRVEGVRFGVQG